MQEFLYFVKDLHNVKDTLQTTALLPEQSIMITNSPDTSFFIFSKFGEKLTINTSVDKKGSGK